MYQVNVSIHRVDSRGSIVWTVDYDFDGEGLVEIGRGGCSECSATFDTEAEANEAAKLAEDLAEAEMSSFVDSHECKYSVSVLEFELDE